jgi:hypothetical protein
VQWSETLSLIGISRLFGETSRIDDLASRFVGIHTGNQLRIIATQPATQQS